MTLLFVIVIILVSIILGLIVLIQNPKGGGLAGNIAGFSTQFMGVKQTNDVLEKGTWISAGLIGALCILSTFFINRTETVLGPDTNATDVNIPATAPRALPPNTVPLDTNR